MSRTANTEPRVILKGTSTSFLIDANLGLFPDEEPWKTFFKESGIVPESSVDLVYIDKQVDDHVPDVAFIPIADFHRVISRGDDYYQALVIGTSKYTGSVNLPSVLVVRKDDTAQGLDDLMGTEFGYINDSCSSSFYAMSVLLEKQGRKLNEFLKPKKVKAWQGQADAVIAKEVRSTMLPEDVWLDKASNADDTKIIGRYDNAKPALIVARKDLDKEVRASLIDALVTWAPKWHGLYGPFRPYYLAEVFSFYHDLDKLAALVSATNGAALRVEGGLLHSIA